jgi:hypothetical protein
VDSVDAAPETTVEMDISFFEPLVQVTSLAVLVVSVPCAVTFDDDGAERLAAVFSNLHVCRLTFIPYRDPVSPEGTLPTLAALLPFASSCRRLEELSLILDVRIPDAGVDPSISFSPVFRKLSIGHFVEATGWDAPSVARCLATVIPRYCSVVIHPVLTGPGHGRGRTNLPRANSV